MPNPNLQAYRDGFFERFLADLPGTPTLAALEQQQPAGQPLVLMGDYVEYTGPALTPLPGASVTPRFAIRTESGGSPQTFVMLWVVERFDVATDTPETIARILADFRAPTASGTSDAERITSELATNWSRALTGDAARSALARPLSEITAVPAGLPASNIDELRSFLSHFGTYRADGSYYAKGAVADGQFPQGVSADYLSANTGNLAEVKLQRDNYYCYALVPERLWNPQAAATRSRQLVFRIEDQGTDATERWRLALLHTVAANQADAAAARFVFFQAGVGLGVAIPEAARGAVAPPTAALLDSLPAYLENLETSLQDLNIPIVGTANAPYVLLIGAVRDGFPRTPLPDGVIEDGEGDIRTFRCPPPQLRTLIERDDIENLVAATQVGLDMQHAATALNLAARTFPTGITAANTGHGVLVGIVDSGIDGSHPAFLGRHDDATKSRIHSVWRMRESGGQSPYQRSSAANKDKYRSMNFGREYIGHDEVITAQDAPSGHGTHVAGIAAGRGFGTWPGGISPAATIVVAAVGSIGGYVNDIVTGVKYCFQKAAELNLPCVVNISSSTQRQPHDGTDPLSIAVTQLVSEDRIPASGVNVAVTPRYLNGRIICASAGNLRNDDTHWQASIPAGGEVSVLYQPVLNPGDNDGISFWAYNEDATIVRLRISTRHSANAVLATAEVPLMTANSPVSTNFAGGLRVNIHNGPQAPNNRHFNPEIYWIMSSTATPPATAPWIIRFRNGGRSTCVIHGFTAYRDAMGSFVFATAQTQPLIGVTYTADQLRQFNSHKIGSPGNAPGCICVAAFTSEPGLATAVGDMAPFSSPGPLRAVGAGQRAIDAALPGHRIVSAQAGTGSVVAMSGTSMSTPVMTGLVAAMLQMNRNLNTGNLRNRLEIASTRRPADTVDDWGLGRVDASVLLRP